MHCYRCGNSLGEGDRCSNCGADVSYYKKIIYLSNVHYNEGLEQAMVHDLSGACQSLRSSLGLNKNNIAARNLLGLVYYESGHLSEALCEWIVSYNLQSEGNPAQGYIRYFQDSTSEREQMNEIVANYNLCLNYLKNGNDDLAMLHLKKVLSESPKLVEAYQLMGLLCMRSGKAGDARKYLTAALKMDRSNLRTLQYLTNLTGRGGMDISTGTANIVSYKLGNETIIQPRAKKKKATGRGIMRYLSSRNVGTAMLILALVVWFLIIPAHVKSENAKANSMVLDYNEEIQDLEDEIATLEAQLESVKGSDEETEDSGSKAGVLDSYELLIAMNTQYNNGSYDDYEMLTTFKQVDRTKLSTHGQALYDRLYSNTYDSSLENIYNEANADYEQSKWSDAALLYEEVVSFQEDYDGGAALYYMASAYAQEENVAKARAAYEKLINQYPDSAYADDAQEGLVALNVANVTRSTEDDEE